MLPSAHCSKLNGMIKAVQLSIGRKAVEYQHEFLTVRHPTFIGKALKCHCCDLKPSQF